MSARVSCACLVFVALLPVLPAQVFNPANGHLYVLTPPVVDIADARQMATTLGGHVVAINDSAEQVFLLTHFGGSEVFWIGLSDEVTEDVWLWDSGEPYGFNNWCPGEPNNSGGENHVIMNWGGGGCWNDTASPSPNPWRAILELPGGTVNPANDHLYLLTASTQDFHQARHAAAAIGGHLVAIEDNAEESFLVSSFGTNTMWIGFSDELTEGAWIWDTGDPHVYDSFCAGQPDNAGGVEHYAVMNWATGGCWNDLQSPASWAFPGVIEFSHKRIVQPALASGTGHTLALHCDGTIWVRGKNNYGQLGLGNTAPNYYDSASQLVPSALSDVVALGAGDNFSLALKSDGTVWAWGSNWKNQLGTTDPADQVRPQQVAPGQLSGIVAIAAGAWHCLAVKDDGTVWTWGSNEQGELGHGTSGGTQATPQQISPATLSDVVAVAAGLHLSYALKGDGTVCGWGFNGSGNLGLGYTSTNEITPQQIPAAALSGVTAIAAGNGHALALKADGTVWVWGLNHQGQLGLNDTSPRYTPTPIPSAQLSGIRSVAAGFSHSLAVKSDGWLYSWGFGEALGYPNPGNWKVPATVMSGVVTANGSLYADSFAIVDDGSFWHWGSSVGLQLDPKPVVGIPWCLLPTPSLTSIHPITLPTGSGSFILTVKGSEFVRGSNILWNGSDLPTTYLSPTELFAQVDASLLAVPGTATIEVVSRPSGGAVSNSLALTIANLSYEPVLAAGTGHSLALMCDGTVWSWGRNNQGQLGIGTSGSPQPSPQQIPPSSLSGASSVAAGYQYALSLRIDGTVWTWGRNDQGQLGLSDTNSRDAPEQIPPTALSRVVAVSAGDDHSVALKDDGTVWTWGSNVSGALGLGVFGGTHTQPQQIPSGVLSNVVAIAAGGNHCLALKSDGAVWSWGDNSRGQLGLGSGNTYDQATPVQVPQLTGIVAISAGGSHSLALESNGLLKSWGLNWSGQLNWGFGSCPGPPSSWSSATCFWETPGSAGSGVATVAAGGIHTLIINSTGTLRSCGNNDSGQLGYPDPDPVNLPGFWPVFASVSPNVATMAGSFSHTLYLKTDGSLHACGDNSWGQLGIGTTSTGPNYVPQPVGGVPGCTFVAPSLASISPTSVVEGSPSFTLTATGSNFLSISKILWQGVELPTIYVSPTELRAEMDAVLITTAAVVQVRVSTPPPGGGLSNILLFTIEVPTNPVPVLTSLSPSQAAAGSTSFLLAVNGSDFVVGSEVLWDGMALATFLVNPTRLDAGVPAFLLAVPGTATITVVNPAPGGGTSNPLGFTIGNPIPVLGSLTPNTAPAGSPDLPLTVTGGDFVDGSEIRWDGVVLATTYVDPTQLSTLVPAAYLAAGSTITVTVFNPPPMGGESNGLTFTIHNPVPVLTALIPDSIIAGAPAFNLFVGGSDFVPSSEVRWDGGVLTTTFVSPERLVAAVPASFAATPGTATITVSNPSPGGGAAGGLGFTVTNPYPVLTGLSTTALAAGSASTTINLDGFGFVPASEAQWDGAVVPTTYVSATQLQAFLVSTLFLTPGSYPMTVFNDAPGGGSSNSIDFDVIGPRILIISPDWIDLLDPASPPLPMIVTGVGFLPGAMVYANGTARPTTWLSPAQLFCEIDPSIPQATMMGAIALTVSSGPGIYSNTVALPVGAPTATNQGTFAIVPPDAGPGDAVTILLEGAVPSSPLNFYGESGSPPSFYVPSPFDVVLQIFFPPTGNAVKLLDGIGTGFPTTGPDLGGTPPGGTWGLPLVLPNPPWGLQFNIQARYLDATHPVGYRLSWALAPLNL